MHDRRRSLRKAKRCTSNLNTRCEAGEISKDIDAGAGAPMSLRFPARGSIADASTLTRRIGALSALTFIAITRPSGHRAVVKQNVFEMSSERSESARSHCWAALLLPPARKVRENTLHGYDALGTPRTRHGSQAHAKQLLGRGKDVERRHDASDLAFPDIQNIDAVETRLATGRCVSEREQRM
jgi:hypothetical protein